MKSFLTLISIHNFLHHFKRSENQLMNVATITLQDITIITQSQNPDIKETDEGCIENLFAEAFNPQNTNK